MARFETSATLALEWGDNRDRTYSSLISNDGERAKQHAAGLVEAMRRNGASSALREVVVRPWERGTELADAPVVYRASYFDAEQGLTEDEAYAARVHDWHIDVDRINANLVKNNADYRLGYSDWRQEWGPQPSACAACEKALDLTPVNFKPVHEV